MFSFSFLRGATVSGYCPWKVRYISTRLVFQEIAIGTSSPTLGDLQRFCNPALNGMNIMWIAMIVSFSLLNWCMASVWKLTELDWWLLVAMMSALTGFPLFSGKKKKKLKNRLRKNEAEFSKGEVWICLPRHSLKGEVATPIYCFSSITIRKKFKTARTHTTHTVNMAIPAELNAEEPAGLHRQTCLYCLSCCAPRAAWSREGGVWKSLHVPWWTLWASNAGKVGCSDQLEVA